MNSSHSNKNNNTHRNSNTKKIVIIIVVKIKRIVILKYLVIEEVLLEIKTTVVVEGSLNSKLPTIWRVEKQMRSRVK